MAAASTVEELVGFPFASFDEVRQAVESDKVRFSISQQLAREVVMLGAVPLSKGDMVFLNVMPWCWLWGSAILMVIAWSALGWSTLVLPVVALVSFFINRPWTARTIAFFAIGLTLWGSTSNNPLLGWSGGAWLIVWFLSNGWQNWCTDRVRERLWEDEDFFVKAYLDRIVVLYLTKSGERVTPSLTDDEMDYFFQLGSRIANKK